jgi:hypothetical protein
MTLGRNLGERSYPLYLTHNVIGSAVIRVLIDSGLDDSLTVWVSLRLLVLFCWLVCAKMEIAIRRLLREIFSNFRRLPKAEPVSSLSNPPPGLRLPLPILPGVGFTEAVTQFAVGWRLVLPAPSHHRPGRSCLRDKLMKYDNAMIGVCRLLALGGHERIFERPLCATRRHSTGRSSFGHGQQYDRPTNRSKSSRRRYGIHFSIWEIVKGGAPRARDAVSRHVTRTLFPALEHAAYGSRSVRRGRDRLQCQQTLRDMKQGE